MQNCFQNYCFEQKKKKDGLFKSKTKSLLIKIKFNIKKIENLPDLRWEVDTEEPTI